MCGRLINLVYNALLPDLFQNAGFSA